MPNLEWRKLGDLSKDELAGEMKRFNSPMLAELDEIYKRCLGYTILMTGFLYVEQKFATYTCETAPKGQPCIPAAYKNAFAIATGSDGHGGHTWAKFNSYADAALTWLDIITKNEPFKSTKTVEQLIHAYAPSSDGNDERAYVATIESYYSKYNDAAPSEQQIIFGRVQHPFYENKIVPKPYEGAGFDRVSPRQIVGTCMHRWWGYGDKYSLFRLFGTGGERATDALTDYSLTLRGELVRLNDPLGTRAGWANGGSDGLEGDGPLFVRKLGVSAINNRLVSCEFEGKDESLSDPQMDVGSSLFAYWHDQSRVPWNVYPQNPNVGCVTDLDHYEFATKDCPFAGARAERSQFQDLVRGKMRAAQTGGAPDPTPPPDPGPTPDHSWIPDGFTEQMVIGMFGVLTIIDPTGATSLAPFDPKGLISNAWLARGKEEMVYPAAQKWWKTADKKNVVTFSNGWVLIGNDGDRASWGWLDKK